MRKFYALCTYIHQSWVLQHLTPMLESQSLHTKAVTMNILFESWYQTVFITQNCNQKDYRLLGDKFSNFHFINQKVTRIK